MPKKKESKDQKFTFDRQRLQEKADNFSLHTWGVIQRVAKLPKPESQIEQYDQYLELREHYPIQAVPFKKYGRGYIIFEDTLPYQFPYAPKWGRGKKKVNVYDEVLNRRKNCLPKDDPYLWNTSGVFMAMIRKAKMVYIWGSAEPFIVHYWRMRNDFKKSYFWRFMSNDWVEIHQLQQFDSVNESISMVQTAVDHWIDYYTTNKPQYMIFTLGRDGEIKNMGRANQNYISGLTYENLKKCLDDGKPRWYEQLVEALEIKDLCYNEGLKKEQIAQLRHKCRLDRTGFQYTVKEIYTHDMSFDPNLPTPAPINQFQQYGFSKHVAKNQYGVMALINKNNKVYILASTHPFNRIYEMFIAGAGGFAKCTPYFRKKPHEIAILEAFNIGEISKDGETLKDKRRKWMRWYYENDYDVLNTWTSNDRKSTGIETLEDFSIECMKEEEKEEAEK